MASENQIFQIRCERQAGPSTSGVSLLAAPKFPRTTRFLPPTRAAQTQLAKVDDPLAREACAEHDDSVEGGGRRGPRVFTRRPPAADTRCRRRRCPRPRLTPARDARIVMRRLPRRGARTARDVLALRAAPRSRWGRVPSGGFASSSPLLASLLG